MSFLRVLWTLLLNLPDTISLIKQIAQAIDDGAHYIDVRVNLSTYDKAADKAKNDKDTSSLEQIFNPKSDSGNSGNTPSS